MLFSNRKRRNNAIRLKRNKNINFIENNKMKNIFLFKGSEGKQVENLQEKLQELSDVFPNLPIVIIDGYFGDVTKNAVKKFQELNSLPTTGDVDMLTWEKINYFLEKRKNNIKINKTLDDIDLSDNVIKFGSKGRYVSDLQQYLNIIASKNNNIPQVKVDGIFGSNTEQAVLKFQKEYGLNTDGVVGAITWDALYKVSIDEPVTKTD